MSPRALRILVLLGAGATLAPTALAGDIFVPGDYLTIQEAVNASFDGDAVWVDPGTYVERVRFKGKAISVRSTGGPTVTTIDGGGGTVVRFVADEGRDSLIEGFTIRGGVGNTVKTAARVGGGMFCWNSEPTIRGNVIEDNLADLGGGIFCYSSGAGHSPLIERNEIRENRVEHESGGTAHGAGICLDGAPAVVRGNTIFDNSCRGFNRGAGMLCWYTDDVVIEGNRFEANQGFGGGLYVVAGSAAVEGNTFVDNVSPGPNGVGGGVLLWRSAGTLRRNAFLGNQVGGDGGALWSELSSPPIEGNLFARNRAGGRGGAVYLAEVSGDLSGNTMVENSAELGGGGLALYLFSFFSVEARNELYWNNTSTAGGDQVTLLVGTLDIDFSDAQGGEAAVEVQVGTLVWGPQMIDQDPLFEDAAADDYRLSPASPCIEAGDQVVDPTDRDVAGVPRQLDGNLDGVTTPDMGAHEFTHVALSVTGDPTPGGTLTFETTGTAGHVVNLWYGLAESAALLNPYGPLYVDLTGTWGLLPFGTIPSTIPVPLPPAIPTPLPLVLQELAIDPATGFGNLSNDVQLVIE